jgi:hypothetical protein
MDSCCRTRSVCPLILLLLQTISDPSPRQSFILVPGPNKTWSHQWTALSSVQFPCFWVQVNRHRTSVLLSGGTQMQGPLDQRLTSQSLFLTVWMETLVLLVSKVSDQRAEPISTGLKSKALVFSRSCHLPPACTLPTVPNALYRVQDYAAHQGHLPRKSTCILSPAFQYKTIHHSRQMASLMLLRHCQFNGRSTKWQHLAKSHPQTKFLNFVQEVNKNSWNCESLLALINFLWAHPATVKSNKQKREQVTCIVLYVLKYFYLYSCILSKMCGVYVQKYKLFRYIQYCYNHECPCWVCCNIPFTEGINLLDI